LCLTVIIIIIISYHKADYKIIGHGFQSYLHKKWNACF
jgi:hypothetical protein